MWARNAPGAHVTITRVTMSPGAVSPRHSHPVSEQTWMIERGSAVLLTDGEPPSGLAAGDVVRTPAGAVHGIENVGSEPFVYLAITAPPQDVTGSYRREVPARSIATDQARLTDERDPGR